MFYCCIYLDFFPNDHDGDPVGGTDLMDHPSVVYFCSGLFLVHEVEIVSFKLKDRTNYIPLMMVIL